MYGNFIYTPHVCLPEEGVKTFGTGVTDGCEPWYRFWGLNLGSLQEQQVLLSPEPSLQPEVWLSWGKILFKKGVGSQFLSIHKPSFPSPYFTYLLYIPIEAPTLLTQPLPLSFEKGEVPLGHCPILAKEYTLEAFFEETEESPPGLESCYLCYPVVYQFWEQKELAKLLQLDVVFKWDTKSYGNIRAQAIFWTHTWTHVVLLFQLLHWIATIEQFWKWKQPGWVSKTGGNQWLLRCHMLTGWPTTAWELSLSAGLEFSSPKDNPYSGVHHCQGLAMT